MRRTLVTLALLTLALGRPEVFAQPAAFGFYENSEFSPDFELLDATDDLIRFRLDMSRLQTTGTIDFFQPQAGTWGDMNYGGHLMPRFTFYLALPNTGNVSLVIEDWNAISRPAVARTIPENSGSEIQLGDVGILAGVRIVPVTVKPFDYTNGQTSCVVMSEATIRINIDSQPGPNPLASTRSAFSESARQLFKSVVANWQSIPNINEAEPSHMLVFLPDVFSNAFAEFIEWKRQLGMQVTVVLASEINGDESGNALRARILQELQTSSPRIDYVLFVGDEDIIPVHDQHTDDPLSRFSDFSYPGQFTNEGHYTELEGSDVFPDVFLGRWVINSVGEVRTIAAHTVLHERDTFLSDSLRFNHAVVAADFTEDTQQITKQRAREMLREAGFADVDTLWGAQNPSPQPLLNWLTEGLTFVNYRGSGWQQGWAGINFYYWNVPEIENSGKLPIVTGIGCGVAKFDAPDNQCFGEVWMTHGSSTNPQGAAGFIGPCWNTHTAYNDCLDTCLYRAMLEYNIGALMPALTAGKMFAWAVFEDFVHEGGVNEVCKMMMRQYLVLSDPSLKVYTQTPVRLAVSVPSAVPAGPFQIRVTVTAGPQVEADSMMFTLSTAAGTVTSSWLPTAPGQYQVPVNFSQGDEVTATLSGQNILTRQWQIEVAPSGAYLSHQGFNISDAAGNGDGRVQPGETITLLDTVRNIGADAAFAVTGALATTQEHVSVTVSQSQYGTVGSNEAMVGQPAYGFTVSPEILGTSSLVFELTYSGNQVAPRTDEAYVTLYMPELSQEDFAIIDGNNGLLERYEPAGLTFTLRNTGNETLVASTLTLTTDDPYLGIEDNTASLPMLAPGESYALPSDAVRIIGAGNAPSGTIADLNATVTAQMSTYQFSRTIPFQFVLGAVGPNDPQTGSDGQYYFYDDTDVIYDRVPVYDWFEISPTLDGPGTSLAFTQSQQTFTVPVPFSYSYFGTSFSELSISTDGWVAPGSTDATSYSNQPLPQAVDFVSGMIAVLWNDLWYFFGDDGDVSYYYDSVGDRFIVEWHEIADWGTGTRPNTFQVQLLNPATHPTPTGDAEWLFMYQDLTYHVTAATGATIGYENMEENEGATYYFNETMPLTSAQLQDGRALRLTTSPPSILDTDEQHPILPDNFLLHQNYPNPFNPETTIEYSLPARSDVKLEIFDVLGRNVATLASGYFEAGIHQVKWNGKSGAGVSVPSGLYFYRLSTPEFKQTQRMLLMR